MSEIRIIDIRDAATFRRLPPCADPGFDHRSCDFWEDADRGSKAARLAWWDAAAAPAPAPRAAPANPFAPTTTGPAFNPFAVGGTRPRFNPFGDDDAGGDGAPDANPFAPRREKGPAVAADAPRKLQLLGRGLAIFGTYAKVLELDGEPAVYAQFGPLSAYPRAQRVRELYAKLPSAPLPAVITCISSVPAGRGRGLARQLVEAVCDDLAGRGFAAVEAYPELGTRPDATSAPAPTFWLGCGFVLAVDDERYPVVRREL